MELLILTFEHIYLAQLSRIATLVDELQAVKLRNVQVNCFPLLVCRQSGFVDLVVINQFLGSYFDLNIQIDLAAVGISPDSRNANCFSVQLERQLNAIYNKEEEERIRKEEAAKGDR